MFYAERRIIHGRMKRLKGGALDTPPIRFRIRTQTTIIPVGQSRFDLSVWPRERLCVG